MIGPNEAVSWRRSIVHSTHHSRLRSSSSRNCLADHRLVSVDTSIVMPAIWMGHSSLVFKTLGKQITPANMFCLMSLWADLEPIRQIRLHPEFMAFAERIGLTAAWQKYGEPDLPLR